MFRIWTMRLLCWFVFAGLLTACKKKDLNDPVIIIEGDNPLFIGLGGTWEIPPYSASDIEDGDLTADVIIDNSEINTGQISEWHVVFSVSDNAGNRAIDTLYVNVGMDIDAYIGEYVVDEIRDIDGDGILGEADVTDEIAAFTITIEAGPEENSLIISNFGNYGNGVETVMEFYGNLNDQITLDTFIPDADGIHLTGNGQVTTGTLSSIIIDFDYEAEDGAIEVPCEAQFTKI